MLHLCYARILRLRDKKGDSVFSIFIFIKLIILKIIRYFHIRAKNPICYLKILQQKYL